MEIIVKKFGGTSLADPAKIMRVAELIKSEAEKHPHMIIVVSAMAGETDKLASYCREFTDFAQDEEEVAVVLSSGEQVTSGLLALALKKLGLKARSFQGWEIPFKTHAGVNDAEICEVYTESLKLCLYEGEIPVISGFQGIDSISNRITTLGRGGSDTTAVTIAAVMEAKLCQIYTDVEGVFDVDPNIAPDAKKRDFFSYEEMGEFARLGAKVLNYRALEIARDYKVTIEVLSTFNPKIKGTFIGNNVESETLKSSMKIAQVKDVSFFGMKIKLELLDIIFDKFKEIDLQNLTQDVQEDMVYINFVVKRPQYDIIENTLKEFNINYRKDKNVSVISIISDNLHRINTTILSFIRKEGLPLHASINNSNNISIIIPEKFANQIINEIYIRKDMK